MTETATPTLATVITGAIGAHMRGVRVALPARVEAYDAATQQVSAQPLVHEGFLDETGARQADRLPVVNGVPVVFPGAGGFRVTFPIAAGDTVLLVFASSSIDRWLALGGEVDPLDDRRHDISDAIAIPGLRDFAHALTSAPTGTMSLGKDGGPTIEISASDVRIGGNNNLVTRTEFLNHCHATAGTGTPSGPIIGAAPAGDPLVFPGTSVLKGG
jgi:hypothetical protein